MGHDEDLISLAGSEIAGAYNLTLNQMESAAEEVSNEFHFRWLKIKKY